MRELFKLVLLSNSIKFILIHNHPSGDATPSINDIKVTKEIIKGAKILKLELVDHIVIGDNTYQSIIKDKNIVNERKENTHEN